MEDLTMLKVLIVDDKEENLYLLQAMLDYNNFKTDIVINGFEALKYLEDNIPDLIISDILMPVMDGFTLCRECKRNDRLKNIPFFFYTATYTDSRDEEYALSLGADRFILKPQEPDDFLLIINKFFEEVKQNPVEEKELTQQSEAVVLKEYSEVLVRKIEDKMLQTEKAEKELRIYATLLENEINEHKKSEERFHSTLDNMIEGCQLIGFDWSYLYLNNAAENHLRRSKEDLLGQKLKDCWPNIESTELYALERTCMEERVSQHVECELNFQDKSTGWFEFSIQPVPEGIFILSMDITTRKKAEEKNIKLISHLETLTNSVKELSSARDLDTILQIVKKAAHVLTGADGCSFIMREGDFCFYAEGDAVDPKWKGQKIPVASCASGWAMLNKQSVVIEDIYEDSRVNIDLYTSTAIKSFVMIPVNAKEPIGAICNYWNEKHSPSSVEIQLLQTLADSTYRAIENVKLYFELEQRVKARTLQLENANKELEAFSYSVSHDLRTPLRHISGFITLFLEQKATQLTEEELGYLNVVTNSVDDMGKLIEALLSFSRLSRADVQKTQVDTMLLIQQGLELFGEEIRTRGINITIDPMSETFGDYQLMCQVWTNLISNAIKYTGKRDEAIIRIGSYTESRDVIFYIKDNGAGFNMKYADKLFGVFQRLHKPRDFEGIGIGLANVNRIITRHGGRCWAEGEIDKGATFFFSLPNE